MELLKVETKLNQGKVVLSNLFQNEHGPLQYIGRKHFDKKMELFNAENYLGSYGY